MPCGCCCSRDGVYDEDDPYGDADTFNEALNPSHSRNASPFEGNESGGDGSGSDTGTNYSCSEYERAIRNPAGAAAAADESLLPTWMIDKEAEVCWGCESAFQELSFWSVASAAKNSPQDKTRRHHCRRCRNVFCGACTSNKAIIMLSVHGAPAHTPRPQPVRVCDKCCKDIPDENHFLQVQRPLLLRGALFTKSTMLGMSQALVRMLLSYDGFSLIMDSAHSLAELNEANSSGGPGSNVKRKLVALSELDTCDMGKKLTQLEINMVTGKTYTLEADTSATVQAWLSALKAAAARAKIGSLKTKVELERRQKKEAVRRNEDNRKKYDEQVAKRHKHQEERSALRDKYRQR